VTSVLRVTKPGLFSTLQDLGRHHCADLGIPPGGAMDLYSHRLANAVVGNPPAAPTLEMTLLGGQFEVLAPCILAVAGADMRAERNGTPIRRGVPESFAPGDTLAFRAAKDGCVAYLAIAGGFRGQEVLGSQSTYALGRLGGHFGRALRAGDVLLRGDARAASPGWEASDEELVWPLTPTPIRFVRGPQAHYFTDRGYATFTGSGYRVSSRSNRLAYRLMGPAPEVAAIPRTADTGSGPTDIIEDGNAVGAIQIAGGSEPICMGRDCPTTGAYAKIGCLVSTDVSRLFQRRPGDVIHFAEVTFDEAVRIAQEARDLMNELGGDRTGPPAEPYQGV